MSEKKWIRKIPSPVREPEIAPARDPLPNTTEPNIHPPSEPLTTPPKSPPEISPLTERSFYQADGSGSVFVGNYANLYRGQIWFEQLLSD